MRRLAVTLAAALLLPLAACGSPGGEEGERQEQGEDDEEEDEGEG